MLRDTRSPVSGMKYRYSIPLAEEAYKGKIPTVFQPRIHLQNNEMNELCWGMQKEMKDVGLEVPNFTGCIDLISGNWSALCHPEALPDRMPIITAWDEWAFMYDDFHDEASNVEEFVRGRDEITTLLTSGGPSSRHDSKQKAIQARLALQMLEADSQWGPFAILMWKRHQAVPGASLMKPFGSLEEYLAARFENVAADIVMALIRFSADSVLTKEELFEVKPITDLNFNAIILFHDYSSWEKEDAAYKRGSSPFMLNAIEVLMRVYDLNLVEAKQRLWAETVAMEQRYCDARDEYIKEYSPNEAIIHWFGLIELCVAGNAIWSTTTTRYDKSRPAPTPPNLQTPNISYDMDTSQSSIGIEDNEQLQAETSTQKKRTRDEKINVEDSINDTQFVLEPFRYVSSLSAGKARGTLLDSLNNWFLVSAESLNIIHDIVEKTHNISLLLDDVYDHSPTRRSKPATHTVYGPAQTINSATFVLTECFGDVLALSDAATKAWIDELRAVHIGQSQDLYWTFHCKVPTVSEYLRQVEQKTGGLFSMAARLMQAEATTNSKIDLTKLMVLLGRYFQVRDDYYDIISIETDASKHSDLDQVTFTLPIIHAITKQQESGSTELLSLLQSNRLVGRMEPDNKTHFLNRLKELGSLEHTKTFLSDLHTEFLNELELMESETGVKNWILRLMLFRLKL